MRINHRCSRKALLLSLRRGPFVLHGFLTPGRKMPLILEGASGGDLSGKALEKAAALGDLMALKA